MKLPQSLRNWISIIGATIALMNIIFIIFLFIASSFFDIGGSYVGLIIYIILPFFLIFGLLLIPIGMYITKRKSKKEASSTIPDWPTIDFNKKGTRNATIIFTVGSLTLFIFSSLGSYEAFHYLESNEFCGTVCHKVMEPEYVAYHESAHERVKCVECHVGSGAENYIDSKISGLRQVYSILTKSYPKPIPTPIHNLRPAEQTCEHCHWPEKFYDRKHRNKSSYLADEENTEWIIHLQMKTSASTSALGQAEGIHWHINPDVKIEYIASSYDRAKIPWVKYTNLKTNEVFIYEDKDNKLTSSQMNSLEVRTMDCLDCHNRPAHDYKVPQNIIDDYITSGEISKSLPDIKVIAMEFFAQDYPTKDSAFIAIKAQVMEYYDFMYPEVLEEKKTDINKAIAAIQKGYSEKFFPEMGVSWSAYPNHLGHLETPGCVRCHDDKHVTSGGEQTISRDCNLCHEILAQGSNSDMQISSSLEPLEFKHPINIKEKWRTTQCTECHLELY